jgi:hypothetical protein
MKGSHMTESAQPTTAAPQPSFWEDLIDIYFSPAGVFRRWQFKSMWPPTLFVAIAIGVITFFTFNTLAPAFEADIDRSMAAAATSAPAAANAAAMEQGRNLVLNVTRYTVGLLMVLSIFIVGVGTWLLGKLVGGEHTFHAALVVAAWAYMPRVIGAVLGGIQGLLMDPASMKSVQSLSIGPARFFDPDVMNPLLYQLLGRLDLMILWTTVLLAIGLYVTGKVSKGQAAVFGLLIWFVGSLPVLRSGYMSM